VTPKSKTCNARRHSDQQSLSRFEVNSAEPSSGWDNLPSSGVDPSLISVDCELPESKKKHEKNGLSQFLPETDDQPRAAVTR
jgi:hypothetical protein